MTDRRHETDQDLLSLCAILRRFDRNLLLALAERDAIKIDTFLASEWVVPDGSDAGRFRLDEDGQEMVLSRLRLEQPLAELELHTRAFKYFLHQLERQEGTFSHIDYIEEQCFYHLGILFDFLSKRRELHTITQYTARMRAANPRQAHHRHLLAFYEGYVLIYNKHYDQGELILSELIEQDNLAKELQLRVSNTLGHMHWFQTHYDRALVWYQRVRDLASEIGDISFQSRGLLNMGIVLKEIGYYDQALELVLQSLQLSQSVRDQHVAAHALYETGNIAMQLGRWQMAREHFREAIRLYETLDARPHLANLYWCQGFLHHMCGDELASKAAYRHGLAIAQSPEHGDAAVAMDTLLYLGFLEQTQGRWSAALAHYEEAATLAQRLRNQHMLSFIHYRRGDVFKRQGRPAAALAAYQQAIATIETLRGITEKEEIKIGLLGTTQQIYEALVLLCLELERPAEAFHYVERARSRAFLDLLAHKAPDLYDAVDQPVVTLADVQAHLPEDALLVEYFTAGVLPRGEYLVNKLPAENARLRNHLTLPPQVLIFAVTRDSFAVYPVALDPNTLRPQVDDPGPGRRLLRERMLTHLYDCLIGPVQPLLRGRTLLHLIPHGPLHYVPFMALRSRAGDHLLDAAGPAITLAPSATILLRNCFGRPPRQGGQFLALGYNDTGARALRYAEAEAHHVARVMGGAAWIGAEPKSRRLIANSRAIRWLHIAGHAVYNPGDPLDSLLRLGPDDDLSARAIIGNLDLNADLVTLSACTSGVSHVVPGDELLGLQRALLYAGAPTVVCTLWEAADLVALLVMERFYTGLRQGFRAAVALRDAQVAVRRMTGRDLHATIERWKAEDPPFLAQLVEVPPLAPEDLDAPIFADPEHWATFMLIGRP